MLVRVTREDESDHDGHVTAPDLLALVEDTLREWQPARRGCRR